MFTIIILCKFIQSIKRLITYNMKKVFLVIFISFWSVKNNAQTTSLDNWVKELDAQIELYDKKAREKKTVTENIKGIQVQTVWYRKKKKIKKIKKLYGYYKHPLEVTYYFKKKQLVMQRKLGAAYPVNSTLQQKDYFSIHDVSMYLKNKNTAQKKARIEKMLNHKEYYSAYTRMLKLPYIITKYSQEDAVQNYNTILELAQQ